MAAWRSNPAWVGGAKLDEIEANAHTMPEYRTSRTLKEAYGPCARLHVSRVSKISDQIGIAAWFVLKFSGMAAFSVVVAAFILIVVLSAMDTLLDAAKAVMP